MPTLSYPDSTVPGAPRIRLDVPDGWEPLDVPQTLLAAREAAPPGGAFATNVTVSHLVRPALVTESILVDELRDVVAGKTDGQISDPYEQVINGQPVHGINLSYIDSQAGTLGQIHLFARRVVGEQASIVQLVISFGGARSVELRPALRQVAQSLDITWPDDQFNETANRKLT